MFRLPWGPLLNQFNPFLVSFKPLFSSDHYVIRDVINYDKITVMDVEKLRKTQEGHREALF